MIDPTACPEPQSRPPGRAYRAAPTLRGRGTAAISISLCLLAALPPLALSSADPAPSAHVVRVDGSGQVVHERVPAGTVVGRLSIPGRPERSRSFDPNAPQRVLVEFDVPPLLVAAGGSSRAATPMMRASQLRTDLARLGSRSRVQSANPEITHEYREVFSGVALSAPSEVLEAVRRLPYVRRMVPDDSVHAMLAESVPLIRADVLRNTTGATGAGIRVGIIDTGIDYSHPALGSGFGPGHKVAGGYDFVNADSNPMDDQGHGTHVAGIVAANGPGLVGVAPQATLYAFKVLDQYGSGQTSTILAALEQTLDPDRNPATNDAMHVVNLSLGSFAGSPDDPMSLALDHLTEAGVVCCVAAGNSGGYREVGSPGTSRRAITVGATDKRDVVAYFSSRGPVPRTYQIKPDIMAPGVSITSCQLGGGVVAHDGTSMSTPHVAGCAALLRQRHPAWTPEQIKSALVTTAHSVPGTPFTRATGRVDAVDADAAAFAFAPQQLAFGRIPMTASSWSRAIAVSVKNLESVERQLKLPASFSIASGAIVRVAPENLTLAPGATGSFVATLTVDAPALPPAEFEPYGFASMLVATCEGRTYQLPAACFRHAVLAFDERDWFFPRFVEEQGTRRLVDDGWGARAEIAVPPGTYDVTAAATLPFRFVQQTGIVVVDSAVATLDPATATTVHTVAYTDRSGKPLEANTGAMVMRRPGSLWSMGWIGLPVDGFSTPPGAAELRLDWANVRTDWQTSFTAVGDRLEGAGAGTDHRNPDGDWRRFSVAVPRTGPGDVSSVLYELHPMGEGFFGFAYAMGTPTPAPFQVNVESLQPLGAQGLLGLWPQVWRIKDNQLDYEEPEIFGPVLRVDRWPIETHPRWTANDPVATFEGDVLRLFAGMPIWLGRFQNSPTRLSLIERDLYAAHFVADGYGAMKREADPPFTLRDGAATIASGTLAGAGGFAWRPIEFPLPLPGLYELRSRAENALGSLEVVLRMNTAALGDRDPPVLRGFQLRAHGAAADTADFTQPGTAELHFRITDDAAFTVRLAARPAGSDGVWTEFPAADLAGESVATPPNSLYGWTAIRLTATDAAGNSSEFTWDRAYFSIPGGLPVGPDGRPLLTLQGAAPNPSRGGTLALVIVLPDDAPAELEVLDVGGRRITTRPVGTLGAGRHRVALPPGTALPPGMYFARLRKAGEQRVTRFVVLE